MVLVQRGSVLVLRNINFNALKAKANRLKMNAITETVEKAKMEATESQQTKASTRAGRSKQTGASKSGENKLAKNLEFRLKGLG